MRYLVFRFIEVPAKSGADQQLIISKPGTWSIDDKMKNKLLAFLIISQYLGQCNAYYYAPYFSSSIFPRPLYRQFEVWWPKEAAHLKHVSTTTCNATLHDYNIAFDAPRNSAEGQQLLSRCYQHEGCLVNNLQNDWLLNFQSATVLLGLAPTLLASIGLSIPEIGHLSGHRPFLALLLSVGAPAIWSARVFDYAALVKLKRRKSLNKIESYFQRPMGRRAMLMVLASQYFAALLAVANVLWLSVDITKRIVLSWGCTSQSVVFIWVLLSIVVHITSAAGFALLRRAPGRGELKPLANFSLDAATSATRDKKQTSVIARSWAKLTKVIRNMANVVVARCVKTFKTELTPCRMHDCRCLGDDDTRLSGWIATLLITASSCFSFGHIVYGTIVFSSLQFITVSDAINLVIWRFVISTVVCRVIIIVETRGIQNHT